MIRKSAEPQHRKIEIRGCCDLGSSYFRLLVVEAAFPGGSPLEGAKLVPRSVRDERRYAGWGADLVAEGAIGARTLSRALGALAELVDISRGARCPVPLLVATNTLREARNAPEIVRAIEDATGMKVRVLSQREEASFGFAGAAFFAKRRGGLCLVDIGGTSTEVSWGRGASMDGFTGIATGTHRVDAALGLSGAGGDERSRVADALESYDSSKPAPGSGVYPLPPLAGDTTMLVTGGTAVSLAAMRRLMRGLAPGFEETESMTLEELAGVRLRLAGILRSGDERSLPFDAARVRLLPAGVMLAESLLRALGAREFGVTKRDLRWGMVLSGGGAGG